MALKTEPPFKVAWPPGHGFEYTVKDGDNWGSVAARDGWTNAWELINFNFGINGKTNQDLESRWVNWCLETYVGCIDETLPDHNNYRFSSAAKPGVIYTKNKLKGGSFEDHLPFRVRRTFWPILQRAEWDCWATIAAIMMSYRNGRAFTALEAAEEANTHPRRGASSDYVAMYTRGAGLPLWESAAFARCCRMAPILARFGNPSDWLAEMTVYGPLAVVNRRGRTNYHAWFVFGMFLDGHGSIRVNVFDPSMGGDTLVWDDFQNDYETVYRPGGHPLIWRWPGYV